MAILASDWLRHFRLLLWNRWTEFNETWQEARSQHPLPSFSFSGRLEKTRWPPWPLIGGDIFYFYSETAEWISMQLDRKQDLNILYQVCLFGRISKQKGSPWSIPLKVGKLNSGARYVALWAPCLNFAKLMGESISIILPVCACYGFWNSILNICLLLSKLIWLFDYSLTAGQGLQLQGERCCTGRQETTGASQAATRNQDQNSSQTQRWQRSRGHHRGCRVSW